MWNQYNLWEPFLSPLKLKLPGLVKCLYQLSHLGDQNVFQGSKRKVEPDVYTCAAKYPSKAELPANRSKLLHASMPQGVPSEKEMILDADFEQLKN